MAEEFATYRPYQWMCEPDLHAVSAAALPEIILAEREELQSFLAAHTKDDRLCLTQSEMDYVRRVNESLYAAMKRFESLREVANG